MLLVLLDIDGAMSIDLLPVRSAACPVTVSWCVPFGVLPIETFFVSAPFAGALPDASTVEPIAMEYFSAGSSPVTVTVTVEPHLRRVLDPLKQHDASYFVIADRAAVRLDIDNTSVDVVEFRGAAKESLAAHARNDPGAIEMLEAAAAMHTGDFLSDDLYEDWAAGAREEVEALGGDVIRALAFALAKTSDPQRAVAWFARLLHYDPHDEPTYEALIFLLASDRRHGEARRYHRMYEMRMRELDVPAQSWEDMTG